jgi:YVTN family beta-propeller protein
MILIVLYALAFLSLCNAQQLPHTLPDGYALPNGWTITPAGKSVAAQDMVLNLSMAPDGRSVIALQGGYNEEGLLVIDTATEAAVQHITLPTVWLGLAWHPDGKRLFVSGGNGTGTRPHPAPIRMFGYAEGKLSDAPVLEINETIDPGHVYWAGLVHHPSKDLLYAANRGTSVGIGSVVVFDSGNGKLIGRIPVEVNPYAMAITADGGTLYVSNWASASVSVIDTAAMKVTATIPVDRNPNDLVLDQNGRLFVACSNDNTVVVIDTKTRLVRERIATALFPHSPPGSTPNALALDQANRMLFAANADNNDVAVIRVAEPGRSEVVGFVPAGWYPSALAIDPAKARLYVGNSKGFGAYPYIKLTEASTRERRTSTSKDLRTGSVNIVDVSDLKSSLPEWTRQVHNNTPYRDELLTQAKAATTPSIIPRDVGVGSPIKHVVYIIKENRTYDQIFGDLPQGNGDPALVLFGRKVTPNHHALAEQFVLFDNLYSDGETSAEGHSWADAAYATDFATKRWPVVYSARSRVELSNAYVPSSGYIWDQCARKGLTYRTYGEYGVQVSGGNQIGDAPGAQNLYGHAAPGFRMAGMRDTDNAAVFLRELDDFEKDYDNTNPLRRLPNFIIMSLPEDHTRGTTPGAFTPRASVASNDYALGQIVERLTHSRYWPEMAIFVIEDDAQDGPDHVDARRTVSLAISPYIVRAKVDKTMYSTSSMLRTIELLLGLPPMTQYDAAASPMYDAFGVTPDLRPYTKLDPRIDLTEKNTARAYGARQSKEMDFDDVDRAPMYALNEILWKSIKGARSPMPAPVHRYRLAESTLPPSGGSGADSRRVRAESP